MSRALKLSFKLSIGFEEMGGGDLADDIFVSDVYCLFDPIAKPHFLGPDQLSLIKDDFDRTKFIHRYRPLSRALHCS